MTIIIVKGGVCMSFKSDLSLLSAIPSNWFMNSIAFWTFLLLGCMCIGGYFMFRKFLKVLPKADGKSSWTGRIIGWSAAVRYGATSRRLSWISLCSRCPDLSVILPNIPLLQRSVKSRWRAMLRQSPASTVSKVTLSLPRGVITGFLSPSLKRTA